MISPVPVHASSRRIKWLRASARLSKLPSIRNNASAVQATLTEVISTGTSYVQSLNQPATQSKLSEDEVLEQRTMALATIATAETLLGLHIDRPYGVYPMIAYWLAPEDRTKAFQFDIRHRDLPRPVRSQNPLYLLLDPVLLPFGFDSKTRYLKACARRGEVDAKKHELIFDATMRALERLADNYVKTGHPL